MPVEGRIGWLRTQEAERLLAKKLGHEGERERERESVWFLEARAVTDLHSDVRSFLVFFVTMVLFDLNLMSCDVIICHYSI